ncbi:mechanosensitive ion channel family protein [bacterium]|nr:mechanosensitive ion channel family protein [bacterium]
MDFLYSTFYDNPLWAWLIAAGLTIILPFVFRIIMKFINKRLASIAQRTKTDIDDAFLLIFQGTKFLFLLILSLYIGLQFVELPGTVSRIVRIIVLVVVFLQVGFWGNAIISFLIGREVQKKKAEDPASASAYGVITFFARLVLWLVVVLLTLDNLNIEITPLIAGLGIGGIAIALAAQNILSDVFNSVSIVLDKPFEVGDFIIVGDFLGTVERIGIKTTRLRSLSGEQLIFANSDLINSRVKNYKRMNERRIVFSFGVVYQTPVDKLEIIPRMVREIIESIDQTRFDRAHFQKYGDSSLDFEVVYYVLIRDYSVYMDIQQKINLTLFRQFEKEHIEFAYPTQTLYIQSQTPPSHETS